MTVGIKAFWLLFVEAMAEPIGVAAQMGNLGGEEQVPTI